MPLRSIAAKSLRGIIGERSWFRLKARKPEFSFLRQTHGLVHVGANQGQERGLYAALNLRVIWIEPIPEVFEQLSRNIAGLPEQRAINLLITGQDGQQCEFHIANNSESSSILDLSRHAEMWPEVAYARTISLTGKTLGTALADAAVDLAGYDALILDTQGAELQILNGATALLPRFRFIKVEVPDFEAYKGCCQIADLSAFMAENGFQEQRRIPFSEMTGVGCYYDVVYTRKRPTA